MANHFRMDDDVTGQVFPPDFTYDLTKTPEENKTPVEPEVTTTNRIPKKEVDLDVLMETPASKTPVGKVVTTSNSIGEDAQVIDPTTLIPRKEKVDTGAVEVFSALDEAVARTKEEITEFHKELEAKMYEEVVEKEEEAVAPSVVEEETPVSEDEYDDLLDDDDDIEETVTTEAPKKIHKVETVVEEEKEEETTPTVSIKKTVDADLSYDDDELETDLDEVEEKKEEAADEQKEVEEIVEGLKSATKEYMSSRKKGIDLSKFKISDNSIKVSKVIINEADESMDVADWVLPNVDRAISMSGLTGPELIKLDPQNSNRNRRNTVRDIYKILYDHVVDPSKPNFDNWMKQTMYTDLDHIYFALYMATFNGSNFLSYQCPDCKKVFLKEVNFKDMIKYKDDKVKEHIMELMSNSTENGTIEYKVDLVQVSDKYVFGMKQPSLYNIVMETAGLPDKLLEKYSDLINTITYIDSVYKIDYTNMELVPIAIPVVKDDPVKSTAKRIKSLYDIIKKLSSDEYYVLRGYINKTESASQELTYRIPEGVCPDCDTKIEANEETSANDLLFTRHHLGAFATM